jgi:hypothetical protein
VSPRNKQCDYKYSTDHLGEECERRFSAEECARATERNAVLDHAATNTQDDSNELGPMNRDVDATTAELLD